MPSILSFGFSHPPFLLTQQAFKQSARSYFCFTPSLDKTFERIVSASLIERRFVSLEEFTMSGSALSARNYTTEERNQVYKELAPKIASKAAKEAIERAQIDPLEITHVIYVSCTGMFAPGVEFLLIDELGLRPTVQRYGLNFMGCFGAFKALSLARALALENSAHRVLIVCLELCSLHFQQDGKKETLVSGSLFGDGAASCIVSGGESRGLFDLISFSSLALSKTREMMSWESTNHGYRMKLSQKVPSAFKEALVSFSKETLGKNSGALENCQVAAHPGGRAILEAIEDVLEKQGEINHSYEILKQFGNMSSATFLFVLDELLRQGAKHQEVLGLGFGPGLSIEGVHLRVS